MSVRGAWRVVHIHTVEARSGRACACRSWGQQVCMANQTECESVTLRSEAARDSVSDAREGAEERCERACAGACVQEAAQ